MDIPDHVSFFTSRGAKWFHPIHKTKSQITSSSVAIEYGRSLGHTVFLSKQNRSGSFTFGSYADVDAMRDNLFAVESNMHAYELILKDTPCKLYMDIEFGDGAKYTANDAINGIKAGLADKFKLAVADSQIKVSCASGVGTSGKWMGKTKHSFHVVFDIGYVFPNATACKAFIQSVLPADMIGPDKPVDLSVYSSNQPFRLIYNSKAHDDRVLDPTDHGSFHEHMVTQFKTVPKFFPTEVIEEAIKESMERQTFVVDLPVGDMKLPEGPIDTSALGYLRMIPNEGPGWDFYFPMMCACKNIGIPFREFEEWAAKYERYDAAATVAHWDGLVPRSDGYGKAFLKRVAEAYYPDLAVDPEVRKIREIMYPTVEGGDKVEYAARYMRPVTEYLHDYKHMVIRSAMGTGKTTLMVSTIRDIGKLLKRVPRVLVITPRVTLAETLVHALRDAVDLKLYHELPKGDRAKVSSIVCQLESLWTVGTNYDVVVVDESESNFAQFSSPTNSACFSQVMAKFEAVVAACKWSFWMDAFVTDRTIDVVTRLCGSDVLYIHNTHQPYQRTAIRLEGKREHRKHQYTADQELFVSTFARLAREGKRCVIVAGSKGMVANVVAAVPEGQTIFALHGRSEDAKKKLVRNVNEEWAKYDHVCYTTCITVGVNCDIERFDVLLVHFSACGALPRDVMQSTMRVRKISTNTMYYITYARYHGDAYNDEFSREQLESDITSHIEFGSANLLEWQTSFKDYLRKLWVYNRQENNVARFMFEKTVRMYLRECGYTDESPIVDKGKEFTKDLEYIPFWEIDDINSDEALDELTRAIKNRVATFPQKLKYYKYRFVSEIVHIDAVEKGLISPSLVCAMFNGYLKDTATIDRKLECCRAETKGGFTNLHVFVENRAERLVDMRKICEIFGLRASSDLAEIPRDRVAEACEFVVKDKERLKTVFGLRFQESNGSGASEIKRGLDIINQIFRSWGFTVVKRGERKQKRDPNNKKKFIDVSAYAVVPEGGVGKEPLGLCDDPAKVFVEMILRHGKFIDRCG